MSDTYYNPRDLRKFGKITEWDEELGKKFFDWYGEDFAGSGGVDIPGVGGKQEDALQFVAAHSDAETAAWLQAGGYTVSYAPYDWSVNQP